TNILYSLYRVSHSSIYSLHLHAFPTRRSSDLPDPVSGQDEVPRASAGEVQHRASGGIGDCRSPRVGQLEELIANPSAGTMLDFTDRKSTRLNSSHGSISYAVFCLKKKST